MAVLVVAWGGGGLNGFLRTWRATSNGLEGVTALHCDALLCLDEMSQVDGREAGSIAYMLANGSGKSRAGRSGEARSAASWRVLFLSSGEISLADKLAEDGHARRAATGQEVRIVDIPADAGVGLNGTQAAIRAGYARKIAKQQADQLLSKLDVRLAVKDAMAERAGRTEITQDRVTLPPETPSV